MNNDIANNMKYNLLVARFIKEKLDKMPEFHDKQISLLVHKSVNMNTIYNSFNSTLSELLQNNISTLSTIMTKEELDFINNPSNLSLLYSVDKGSEVDNDYVSYIMYL